MNKFVYISLLLVAIILTGCATYDDSTGPQGQTYANRVTTTFDEGDSGNVLSAFARHAVNIPQEDSFTVEWISLWEYNGAVMRFCSKIIVRPGGSLTPGEYECLSVEAKENSRRFYYDDPELGITPLEFSSDFGRGGYVQSGTCDDLGWHTPEPGYAAKVIWTTHKTRQRETGHTYARRKGGCVPASYDEVAVARQLHQMQQQLVIQKAQMAQQLELQTLQMEHQAELRRRREEIESRQ